MPGRVIIFKIQGQGHLMFTLLIQLVSVILMRHQMLDNTFKDYPVNSLHVLALSAGLLQFTNVGIYGF